MIKGCNKRVIVMRDTGNAMIEEAIFIIKPCSEKGFVCEEDIVKQANSILDRTRSSDRFSGFSMNVKQKKSFGFMSFVSGALMGTILATVIFLIF